MTDLTPTIIPKSDQLNADDLLVGPRTIRVTKVTSVNSPEQPISVHYEGGDGKPYKPCKSMRRVMVQLWGPDGSKYTGRSMTLYCDPAVKFGGDEVGGIRISHMSHIDQDVTLNLTATRGKKKPFRVARLVSREEPKPEGMGPDALRQAITAIETVGPDGLEAVKDTLREKNWSREEKAEIKKALEKKERGE